MMKTQDLLIRLDYVISKANAALQSKSYGEYGAAYVTRQNLVSFRSAGLTFLAELYGDTHTYYREFSNALSQEYVHNVETGISVLDNVRHAIEQGWLTTMRQLVTAELFSDFLEMAEHLLNEKYKDPAAVMIGSVLEEHLRQLCQQYAVDTTIQKGSDTVPKRTDQLNADLTKSGVYGVLDQKSVTAWLDLRNKAAHGKYTEYKIEQVQLMYQGVLDFINRTR